MSTPNVREMMRAMRGQPNRGFRDLSSTIARMSVSLGLWVSNSEFGR